jgi:hypothetical protein
MPFDGSRVPALQARWIREWSDPLAIAHADWLVDLPRRLRERAAACTPARRVLNALLRERAGLVPIADLAVSEQAPWALGDRSAIESAIESAGWLLLQPWAGRLIDRASVAVVIRCVGSARYESAFRQRPRLWLGEPLLPPAAATSSGEALRKYIGELGWAAAAQVLDGARAPLTARIRLLTGRRPPPSPSPPASLAIDHAALLAALLAAPATAAAER